MNKLLLPFVCVGLSSTALSAVPFSEIIGEDVELFLSVRSFSEIREEWAVHPIVELFEDESLTAFFDGVTDAADDVDDSGSDEPSGFTEVMEEVFGVSYDELFELFPGQASLAFYNLSDLMLESPEKLDMVLMAEFSGNADRLEELMQIQFKRNMEAQQAVNPLVEHEMIEESFMGETLHFDETFNGESTYIEDGYALVDGILIMAVSESRLRETVEMIKEGTSASIAQSDTYQRSREDAGRGDVTVYLNLEEFMPRLNDAFLKLPMVNNLAMFGVTAQSLNRALSLESLQALYFDFELIDAGMLSHYGLLYREKLGLLSLLSYGKGELPEARYVTKGVLSSSVSLYDFTAMLANFEKLLTLASPTLLPMVDMQFQMVRTNTGVDLRAAILENLGEQMVSLSMLSDTAAEGEGLANPEQLFVVDVKDSQAFAQAVETFKGMVPGGKTMFEEQAYEGETIYSIQGPEDPSLSGTGAVAVSYVITRSQLIVNVGRIGLLHEVLSRMSAGSDGLWQQPETRSLFERIERPNAVTRSFVDAEQMIKPFFQALLEAAKVSGLSQHLRADQIPSDLDAAYRLISEMNEIPGGLIGRTLMIKGEDAE